MKKNYLFTFLLTLCFSASLMAQVSLPHYESFDYSVGTDIATTTNWENFSGTDNPIDVVAGSLSFNGLETSTGNSINMVGGFQDNRILFNEVTSGEVYASFLLKVKDISSITDTNDGGYFGIFGSTTNSFRARFWVKPTDDSSSSSVDFAYTNSSSGSGFGKTQNLNDVVLVVMSYNVENGELKGWINPDVSSFGASAPAADFTDTDGSPTTIDRFMLRQDSTGETPDMDIDELRLGTTWASVTPSGTVSNDPTLSFVTPSNNQVFSATTEKIDILLSLSNFTLSGDNGSGESDGTGDGYIKGSSTENGQPDGDPVKIFDVNAGDFDLKPGSSYTLTAELVNNDGSSLSPKVEVSVAFSVELPCDIQLGTITEVCDAITSGTDTYTTTIPFTEGNTSTYTITAKDSNDNNVGTIEGDSPSTTESGNIIISGVPEGTNFTVKVIGGAGSSCDLTRNISSPTCVSLPIYEPFDYTASTDLIAQPLWQDASTSSTPNNIQVVANDDGGGNLVLGSYYTNNELPAFTGNMVTLSAAGSDPFIGFEDQTDFVLASFTFSVTDMSSFQDEDGGYFAVLTEGGSFRARVWIKDPTAGSTNEGLNFQVGLSTTSGSSATFNTNFTGNIGEPVFVVIGFDLESDEAILWVNPDPTGFGDNKGAPNTDTVILEASSTSSINRFLLRQDSTNETPSINFDELRIGNDWAQVTSNPTASTRNTGIEGFALYPNPVRDGKLNIRSNSTDKKQVSIFNVLGKNVINTTVTGTNSEINVSSISSGVYILKVIEGTKTATSKLVIR